MNGYSRLIIVVTSILVASSIAVFAYRIVRHRSLPMTNEVVEPRQQDTSSGEDTQSDGSGTADSDTNMIDLSTPDPEKNAAPTDSIGAASIDVNQRDGSSATVKANITNEHCRNDCKAFAGDFSFLEYCQQVCGLSPTKTVSSADCDSLNGLYKDYCLKDLAIGKNNLSTCKEIADTNIRTTCTARVTEDIVETR
jgi:hypothetical protein